MTFYFLHKPNKFHLNIINESTAAVPLPLGTVTHFFKSRLQSKNNLDSLFTPSLTLTFSIEMQLKNFKILGIKQSLNGESISFVDKEKDHFLNG